MNMQVKFTIPIILALLGAGCVSTSTLVEERLDIGTGVTVTHATAPIMLYHDNSAYAAHARDYVYLGPVEINRMGDYSYYLWLGIWSTISDEDRSLQRDGFESITLFVDGEPLQLELVGWTLESIGVSEPVYVKPVASAADAYYRVTIDQIRLINQLNSNVSSGVVWLARRRSSASSLTYIRTFLRMTQHMMAVRIARKK